MRGELGGGADRSAVLGLAVYRCICRYSVVFVLESGIVSIAHLYNTALNSAQCGKLKSQKLLEINSKL